VWLHDMSAPLKEMTLCPSLYLFSFLTHLLLVLFLFHPFSFYLSSDFNCFFCTAYLENVHFCPKGTAISCLSLRLVPAMLAVGYVLIDFRSVTSVADGGGLL
jgi:hypothetical protein